jgi:carboxypeptidase C (cathepsin A)
MIDQSPKTAGAYCENATVYWLYSADGPGGQLFYYDVGIRDGEFFDTLTSAMSKYLNAEPTKHALHTVGAEWRQADEVGPVGDALLADWAINSDVVLEELLRLKLKVRLYNGVRDLSSCNHLGNLAVLLNLKWEGASKFAAAPFTPWPSGARVEGHIRRAGLLQYATVLRTGHLVPTVVPEVFAALLEDFLR